MSDVVGARVTAREAQQQGDVAGGVPVMSGAVDLWDDYDPDDDPEMFDDDRDYWCDHSEAELDWQGYFECSCGHSWYASEAEMESYWRTYEEANRPPTLWERIQDWWWPIWCNIRRPFRTRVEREMDDDIPF